MNLNPKATKSQIDHAVRVLALATTENLIQKYSYMRNATLAVKSQSDVHLSRK